jgi:GT2 family glycosyltransferase
VTALDDRALVTVIIPTIGRPELLRSALESVAACRPPAAEMIVIDQSGGEEVAAVVEDFASAGAVRLASSGRGIALATNEGLRCAGHETVLVTNDDCTVAEDWIAVACELAAEDPRAIFTGRVIPAGDPEGVPSIKDDPCPQDFTGEIECYVLFAANMVAPRSAVLALGGFDERFTMAAEDNDFCYRWLSAGQTLRYEPRLRAWHHDWRTPLELRRLYARYANGQGQFYAKHLRAGDLRVLRFIASDLRYVLVALRGSITASPGRRRRARELGGSQAPLRPLVSGFVTGWISSR